MRQSFECYRKKIIGKPCKGEPHARFEVAGDGNETTAPSLDPTRTRLGNKEVYS
jgi:hypothetical protein